jgi:6-pyruvoyltetrahydropterin/6-carboxytetrahydropterin synthase
VAVPLRVRVEGIRFAAGHFATFAGGAEPIHGHSYEVAAELEGAVTPDGWVFDFVELKAILRDICDQVDHRFLLQKESTVLEIDRTDTAWKVRTPAGVGYVLPAVDVVALPVDNTTAERLAEWIAGQLWDALTERGAGNVDSAEVEVWEGPGQRAAFRRQRIQEE